MCSGKVSTQITTIRPSAVLIVQLKRFIFDAVTNSTEKNFGVIRISRVLHFTGVPYELRMVVLHIGQTVSHGHYICDLVDSFDVRTCFDDQKTGPIPLARPASTTPYLLMYVRL